MRITSIEEITWKTITPEEGASPCLVCHDRYSTHHLYFDSTDPIPAKHCLSVCAKCAKYAEVYPTWLEEILFQNRLKAAKQTMPESVPAMDAGF